MAAQSRKVVDCGGDAGQSFVDLRAGFPAVGQSVGGGADLVGAETKQMFALAVDAAHVRTEKFVGRAGEEISIQRADVDGAVRGIVDSVNECECAGGAGKANDFFDGIDCAHGV